MQRLLFVLLTTFFISVGSYSSAWASSSATSPTPTQHPDDVTILTNAEIGCTFDHAALFFNNAVDTAMGAVVDENGNPDSSCLGFAFIAADFVSASIWISNDGMNWSCLSGPCP